MRTVTFAGTITVSEGPSITVNQPLDIEVCELTQLTLPKGDKKTVSFGSAKLQFLAVTASEPGLKYAMNGADVDGKSPTLDYPLVLIGENVIARLDAQPVGSIVLQNPLDHPVDFNVVAGRPATET